MSPPFYIIYISVNEMYITYTCVLQQQQQQQQPNPPGIHHHKLKVRDASLLRAHVGTFTKKRDRCELILYPMQRYWGSTSGSGGCAIRNVMAIMEYKNITYSPTFCQHRDRETERERMCSMHQPNLVIFPSSVFRLPRFNGSYEITFISYHQPTIRLFYCTKS